MSGRDPFGDPVYRDTGDGERLRDRAPDWFRDLERRRSIVELAARAERDREGRHRAE